MAKKSYKPTYMTAVRPNSIAAFVPGTYTSQYADQLNAARDNLVNWRYNPLEDASYQAFAKIYGARGNQAAKDTLADAAALNGGYGTSYAVSAAQQARNQYNQELAALIPDLEANAYSRAQSNYGLLKDADDADYGRFRDTEGDRQWAYAQQYNAMRDAMADYQWATNYNTDLYQYQQAQKKSRGGGGGRRSGGGGGGYYAGGAAPAITTSAGKSGSTMVKGSPYTAAEEKLRKAARKVARKESTPMYVNFHTKATK